MTPQPPRAAEVSGLPRPVSMLCGAPNLARHRITRSRHKETAATTIYLSSVCYIDFNLITPREFPKITSTETAPDPRLFRRPNNRSHIPLRHLVCAQHHLPILVMAQLVPLPEVERLSTSVIRILGGNPGKVRAPTFVSRESAMPAFQR